MRSIHFSLMVLVTLIASAWPALAAPVTLVHQGRLTSNGSPVTGPMDLRFTLYDAASGGNVIEGPVTVSGVDVQNGLYSAEVLLSDTSFDGSARWFEIEAAEAGVGSWFTLSPRNRVGTTPEAAHANRADSAASADLALFALDGPFAAPAPVSSSGLPLATTTTTTLAISGNVTFVRLAGSVRLECSYTITNGNVMPSSSLSSFIVTVHRDFESGGPVDLRDAFYGPVVPITVEIVTHDPDYGTTVWTFDGGVAVGYRVESGSAGGAIEEFRVMFAGSQQGPLSATRDFQPAPQPSSNPSPPSLAKSTDPDGSKVAGTLAAVWNSVGVDLSVVDTAFDVRRSYNLSSGQITSSPQYGLVTLRGSAFRDDALFPDFEQIKKRDLEISLEDKGASTPVLQAKGLIVGLELSLADDGRLIEDYEFAVDTVQP